MPEQPFPDCPPQGALKEATTKSSSISQSNDEEDPWTVVDPMVESLIDQSPKQATGSLEELFVNLRGLKFAKLGPQRADQTMPPMPRERQTSPGPDSVDRLFSSVLSAEPPKADLPARVPSV
jgi:hypothetical protein